MHLPGPIRAAVGLAASAADEARRLPDRALELPMTVVGSALQLSLRAQQRYAALTARGDALLGGRSVGDEPPAWATFDDDGASATDDAAPTAADRDAARLVDDLLGTDDPASDPDFDTGNSTVTPIAKATGRGAAAKRAPAKNAATTPARTTPAKKTTGSPAGNSAGKTVPTPRHTAPSKFDDATDD